MGTVRRLVILVSALCVVALVAAGCSHSSGNADGSVPSAPKATPTTLPSQDASRLMTALTNKKPTNIAAALAPAVKASFRKSPKRLLPPGSKMRVLSDKMMVSGDEATVPVKITGGKEEGIWLLTLEKSGSRWLLVGTVRK